MSVPTKPGWYRYKPCKDEDGFADWYWLDADVWACVEVLAEKRHFSAVILLCAPEDATPEYIPVDKLKGQWGARIEFEDEP